MTDRVAPEELVVLSEAVKRDAGQAIHAGDVMAALDRAAQYIARLEGIVAAANVWREQRFLAAADRTPDASRALVQAEHELRTALSNSTKEGTDG